MATGIIKHGLQVIGNSPTVGFESYSTYGLFHIVWSSAKFTNLVFYENGKVNIERYNNGWKPSVTLRNADS